ncbi:MAG TPA: MFS transporter [Bradyrhizobium sp.]|nr:MFS transporter [Bradyrhizobium sp.]
MAAESQISPVSQDLRRRFATWLSLFYGTTFGLGGTYLPFFPVWLKAVGIDPSWIGTIVAAPAVTRFTVLPFLTSLAERRQAVRGAMILTAFATAAGFTVIGTQHQPLSVFLCFAATACVWTPMVPLTDAYALRGVASYGLNYGPLRLWGSVAFILGALACGLLVDVIAARDLIWVIAGMAWIGALMGLGLRPLAQVRGAVAEIHHAGALLRDPGFLGIILASALIQGSHAAYYGFGSITWQAAGLSGLTIAALWAIGVIAEIVVFALSPRFTLAPAMMVMIGALSGVLRWTLTAQEPPLALLALLQVLHCLTFGLTQVGIMSLLVHHVPGHVMARGQGYLAACSGMIYTAASILSGMVYARYGQGVYYLMAAMAFSGGAVMWLVRQRLALQPQSAASGG